MATTKPQDIAMRLMGLKKKCCNCIHYDVLDEHWANGEPCAFEVCTRRTKITTIYTEVCEHFSPDLEKVIADG